MSNYTKLVDFASKDSLPTGDAGKVVKGTELNTEFANIQTAVNSKEDKNSKNVANGYAGLDGTGKLPTSLIPSTASSGTTSVTINGGAGSTPSSSTSLKYTISNGLCSLWLESSITTNGGSIGSTFTLALGTIPEAIRPSSQRTGVCMCVYGSDLVLAYYILSTLGTVNFIPLLINQLGGSFNGNSVAYDDGALSAQLWGTGIRGLQAGWNITYPL